VLETKNEELIHKLYPSISHESFAKVKKFKYILETIATNQNHTTVFREELNLGMYNLQVFASISFLLLGNKTPRTCS
jgi:hypothetical protein